jgi:ATP-dependent exoDNAse (exonuclease V) beta subunit
VTTTDHVSADVAATQADARARELIATDLDETLFVEAGAGTGKTTALVGRIVELVASGRAQMSQVVAITFTEAAAGELRDRIAEALERLALQLADEGEPARRRQRAEEAVAELPNAAIGTLHGFARRILSEHPFEASMPPSIEVFDEVRSAVAFEERWDLMRDALLTEPELETPLLRALTVGVTLDDLRKVAKQLSENWDLIADLEWPTVMQPVVEVGGVVEPLEAVIALSGLCTTDDDRLLTRVEAAVPIVQRLGSSDDPLASLQALAELKSLSANGIGRAPNWGGRIEEVRALFAEAEQARAALITRVGSAALRALTAVVATFTLEAADARRADGRLEFHDLLVLARRLLRQRGDVCQVLGSQWRHLFIDEMQDTDPIQIELAVRIAAGAASAGRDWEDIEVAPGRLFFVGDPKQSIYRFRRADIGQFMAARQRFTDRPLQLTVNRRSVPGIVAWVNALFEEEMGDGAPGMQPAYVPLVAHRPALGGPGSGPTRDGAPTSATAPLVPVVVLGEPVERGLGMPAIRRQEALDIAGAVIRARDEQWPVDDEGTSRPVRFSDMAVLVPTRRVVSALQEAFDEAGVPYRLEGTSVVYRSPEVLDLLTVLRAVDDPTDQVAVVAALRSPLLGCGDDDLARHVLAGGSWDYRRRSSKASTAAAAADGAGAGPVAASFELLRSLHEERWWREPSGLVERVVVECRALELALGRPRPREAWRGLRFVADQARQYTDAFGGDLRRYLRWVDHQRREDVRAIEVSLPESDHDAVRIMTVHAAKGLEFPVVLLAGLNSRRRPDASPVLFGPGGVEVATSSLVRTPGYTELEERGRDLDATEQVRLLYVAATRARDHLVVSVHHEQGTPCHAASIEALCARRRELWRRVDSLEPRPAVEQLSLDLGVGTAAAAEPRVAPAAVDRGGDEAQADPCLDPEASAAWAAERSAALAAAAEPRAIAATRLAKLAVQGQRDAADGVADADVAADGDTDEPRDTPTWRRGRAGSAVGRAVHAVLQSVDLATGDGLADLAAAEAAAEGVPGRADEVEKLAAAALASDTVRRAVAGGRYWRELYVAAPLGDRVIEGFVDLLVDGPDGLTIVDYKTDQGPQPDLTPAAPSSESPSHATGAQYRLQGAGYALAVEQVLGRPVTRCVFLFLRRDGALTREVDDLPAAVDEVRSILDAGAPVTA